MENNESECRVIKRMNRRLVDEGQRLTVSRSPRSLARYIILNTHQGNPVAWADGLETWAREMGVAS